MRDAISSQTRRKRTNAPMAELGPDELDWLCGAEAASVLAELSGEAVTPALVGRLRKTLTPGRASAAIEQAELRERARLKFELADQMFFTRRALEQATDEWVARYKARRFQDLNSSGSIYDFCCGIGGDLIGLATLDRQVVGVDGNEVVARFAQHNASLYSSALSVRCEMVSEDAARDASAWHVDPDRRPSGLRTTSPDLQEPPLSVLEAWLHDAPNAAVKFAPAAQLPLKWEEESELEWISREASCRQQVAWCGELARRPSERTATRLLGLPSSGNEISPASFTGAPVPPLHPVAKINDFVFDPDPALLAAGLHWTMATELALAPFSSKAAYLTGPAPVESPLLASFRVEELLALDRCKLSQWLSQRGIGRLEIKCRGVDLLPERLRAELRPKGDNEATLIVAPAPEDWSGGVDRPCVIICHRVLVQEEARSGDSL